MIKKARYFYPKVYQTNGGEQKVRQHFFFLIIFTMASNKFSDDEKPIKKYSDIIHVIGYPIDKPVQETDADFPYMVEW